MFREAKPEYVALRSTACALICAPFQIFGYRRHYTKHSRRSRHSTDSMQTTQHLHHINIIWTHSGFGCSGKHSTHLKTPIFTTIGYAPSSQKRGYPGDYTRAQLRFPPALIYSILIELLADLSPRTNSSVPGPSEPSCDDTSNLLHLNCLRNVTNLPSQPKQDK